MYLKWGEKTITNFSDKEINDAYNYGYLFTRIGRGFMHQTRSVRIDLSKFKFSSENRRIIRKTESLAYTLHPIPYNLYTWKIGKMAKDFYTEKFGDGTFSANKIKELMTDEEKSNFNVLFKYFVIPTGATRPKAESGAEESLSYLPIGYCIARETNELLHYCYPFYELKTRNSELKDLGLGMMLRAILYAKENGKRHAYLGSAQRPSDTYKMQFAGVEWFDGKGWKNDVDELKILLNQNSNVKRQS